MYRSLALLFIITCALFSITAPLHAGEKRTWTDAQGKQFVAEYLSCTADTVMIRHANGLAVRTQLTSLSEPDRRWVEAKRAEELEATMMEAVFKGEVSWRLPASWSSLGWSSGQLVEIWLCDDKTLQPSELLVTGSANYRLNTSTRNQFEGSFDTKTPVRLSKTARVALRCTFRCSVNDEPKNLTETSTARQLPAANNGVIKLTPFRVSIKG